MSKQTIIERVVQIIQINKHWIPDEQQIVCSQCLDKFKFFWRNRHHCRLCGLLFCGNCCQKYNLNAEFNINIQEKKKLCFSCYNYIKYQLKEKENEVSFESFLQLPSHYQTAIQDSKSIQKQRSQVRAFLKNKIDLINKEIFTYYLNKYDIQNWNDIIYPIIQDSILQVNLFNKKLKNQRNINFNHYFKIKKIIGDKFFIFIYSDECSYLNGLIFKGNILNNKMQTDFKNPKVLLFTNSLDTQNDPEVDIFLKKKQQIFIIQRDNFFINQLITKIIQAKPNIIFIEKSINLQVSQKLFDKGISIVIQVSVKHLQIIQKITGAKIFSDSNEFLEQFEKSKLGNCPIINLEKQGDVNIFNIICQQGRLNHVTIFLHSQNQQLLKKIKECLNHIIIKQLELAFENLQLQNQICISDQQEFICDKLSIQSYIEQNSIEYAQTLYKKININELPDISKIRQNEKSLENMFEYYKTRKNNPNQIQLQQCRFNYKSINFYEQLDQSLGYFLHQQFQNYLQKCEICQKYYFEHISKQNNLKLNIKKKYENLEKSDRQDSIIEEPLPQPIVPGKLNKSNSIQDINTLDLRVKRMVSVDNLSQTEDDINQQKRIHVNNFVQCEICGQIITSYNELNNTMLNFSFARFLQKLFLIDKLKTYQSDECQHQQQSLIFMLDYFKLQFQFSHQTLYKLEFNFKDEKILQQCKINQKNMYVNKTKKLFNSIFTGFKNLLGYKDKLLQQIQKEISELDESKFNELNLDKKDSPEQLQEYYENYEKISMKMETYIDEQLSNLNTNDYLKIEEIRYENYSEIIGLYFKIKQLVDNTRTTLKQYEQLNKPQEILKMLGFIDESDQNDKQNFHIPRSQSIISQNYSDISYNKMQTINQKSNHEIEQQTENMIANYSGIDFEKDYISKGMLDCECQISNLINGLTNSNQDLKFKNQRTYKMISVEKNKVVQGIAHTLNTGEYKHNIYDSEGFNDINQQDFYNSEKLDNLKQFFEKKLNNQTKHFVENFTSKDCELVLLKCYLKNKINESTSQNKNNQQIYNKKTQYQVTIFYPVQFEAIRMIFGISLQDFINSTAQINNWADNSGGKKAQGFEKSFDEQYIFKKVDREEFNMFQSFYEKYFKFIFKSVDFQVKSKNSDKWFKSLLAKIFGLFEIKINTSTYYYIAMENLFYNTSNNIECYDLKGSQNNRLKKREANSSKQVLLDTNFKLFFNGEPLCFDISDKKYLQETMQSDCEFLTQSNIIDYSLLLIINQDNQQVRMGIIDYVGLYNWKKGVESVSKQLIVKSGTTPTILDSKNYSKRFQDEMNKYFISIPF